MAQLALHRAGERAGIDVRRRTHSIAEQWHGVWPRVGSSTALLANRSVTCRAKYPPVPGPGDAPTWGQQASNPYAQPANPYGVPSPGNPAGNPAVTPGGKQFKLPTANLDVDIKTLVNLNFLAQLFLAGMSWVVVFFTAHSSMIKGTKMNPTTGILLIGVGLAGYSAYLSYTYLRRSKKEGLGVFEGWTALKDFYDHTAVNFVGAIATLVALQAQVGSLVLESLTTKGAAGAAALKVEAAAKAAHLGTEALAQAAANTLLAHVVSLIFLVVMIRKISDAYKKLLDQGEKLKQLVAGLGL